MFSSLKERKIGEICTLNFYFLIFSLLRKYKHNYWICGPAKLDLDLVLNKYAPHCFFHNLLFSAVPSGEWASGEMKSLKYVGL